MKKLLLLITFLYTTVCVNAQYVSVINYSKVAAIRNGASVAAVHRTFGYHRFGDGGAVDYIWSATSTAPDDSVIVIKPNRIASNAPGRYIMNIKNGSVDAKQAGVRFDVVNGVGTDDYPYWNALFRAAEKNGFGITAPAEQSYSSQTITITRPLKFIGGIGWNPKNSTQGQAGYTEISFPQNTTGIWIKFSTHNRGSSYFENIVLAANHTTMPLSAIDETMHGWHVNAVTRFRNCGAIGFAGSNFYLFGSNNPDINLWTDVSFSRLDDCFGHNSIRHGLEIEGADASGITTVNWKGNGNAGNSIHDLVFLSNTHITPNGHSNSSPEVAWQRSLVTHGGKVWTATRSGKLGTPGSSSDWADMNAWWKGEYEYIYTNTLSSPNVKPYNAARVYLTGGAFNIAAEIASVNTTVIIGGYTECDQPPSAFGINVLVVHPQICFIRGDVAIVSGSNGQTSSSRFRAATKQQRSSALTWMGLRLGEKNGTNDGATIAFDSVKKAIMFGDAITQAPGGYNDTTFQPSLFTNGPWFGNKYTPPAGFGRTTEDEVNATPFQKQIGLLKEGNNYLLIGVATSIPTGGEHGDFKINISTDATSPRPLGWQNINGVWKALMVTLQ